MYSKSLQHCRVAFRLQTFMFNCRVNMKSSYGGDLTCRACSSGEEESQEHLEVCEGYKSLRSDKDIEYNAEDRVQYFIELTERRKKVMKDKVSV